MGENQSKESADHVNREKLYCSIDLEMLSIEEFRVLGCGHYFCEKCLEAWSAQELINCPKCRIEEQRHVRDLDRPYEFKGQLFFEDPPDGEEKLEIEAMLHSQMIRRARTIRFLRLAAEVILKIECAGAGVKIGGSVTGLVGTGMVIAGTTMSLTGIGAIAGVPLALVGAGVGTVGGLTVGGGIIGETVAKNKQLQGASKHLQADYFHSMQLRILIGRAANNEDFADKINFPIQDAASMLFLLGKFAKFATTSTALAKAIAVGVARGTATAGLHIAGMVISAVLIPVDLVQLILSSVKIHRKDKSEVVINTEKLADDLENELFFLLKDKGYTLVEINRVDNERQGHTLLLAVEGSSAEEVSSNSNVSLEDIHANHVVIADCIGEEIDPVLYEKLIKKWTDEGGNEEDEGGNEIHGGRNEELASFESL